jgi:HK97 family phage major capsid protein
MKMQQTNVMRSISKVSTIDSNRTIPVENALPTTALVGEAVTITSYAPTFSTAISVVPYKYVTATTMSQEFIEDAIGTGNIGSGMDYVADRIAMSLSLKQEEAYTIGTGSGQPQGICVAAGITQVVDGGSGGALAAVTAANLIDLYHTVPVAYRSSPNFRWLVSDTLLKVIRKLTTTNGDFIFQTQSTIPGQLGVGFAQQILGVPVAVGQYVPTATVNTNVYAVIGDFNYFEIFDRTGVTSFIDPYSQASSMQTTMYTYTRTDSHIMLPQAFAALTS